MRPLSLLLVLVAVAGAGDPETVELRVSSTWPRGLVVVDRGERDGLKVGDRVVFFPRDGGRPTGFVLELKDRSATVELHDRSTVPAPGTRGEVRVPKSRFGPEEPVEEEPEPTDAEDEPEPEAKDAPEHPEWRNGDEEYEPGRPLLTGMRPVRPDQRPKRMHVLAYLIVDVTDNLEQDFDNSFARFGTDIVFENPFERGGRLHFDGEVAHLTELDNEEGLDVLLRRLSYAWGGTRFDDQRFEAGRFLQHGMPEFGVLDGVEWTRRRDNGHRYGASFGFLPEPDDDYETLSDLQVALWYEFKSGENERLTAAAGFQKTWHDGTADRDLLVLRVRFHPKPEWDLFGTAWIDFYTGGDDLKPSVEVTQAFFFAARRFENGGIDVTLRRVRFPQILRHGEFTPILDAEIGDNRYDRLAVDGWWMYEEKVRAHGHASGWDDEDRTGGVAEVGVEVRDLLVDQSYVDLTVFGSIAQFEDIGGIRAGFGQAAGRARWDVIYEITQHHYDSFDDDRDDLIQHRVRLSGSAVLEDGWDVSVYAQAHQFDDEITWSVGFAVHKRFTVTFR